MTAIQRAAQLLDEIQTGDDTALPLASAFATLAVAEELARINRKLDEITDGQGSINTWDAQR